MKYPKTYLILFWIMLLVFVVGLNLKDKDCINSEMQYYQAECRWLEAKPDHKVCKAGEMVIYFNMSKDENLTETQVKELAERL